MSEILLREDAGAIAILTLNNPTKLNALSEEMLAALHEQFAALAEDTTIRVVILRGAGKAFCAGHDLREMSAARAAEDKGRKYFNDLFAHCAEMMISITKLPQPVIAEVHGIATAAGCQLVASCDLAVAAEGTRFGVNGVNIGLFCSTPMVALTRNIPTKQAFEMLTTGEFVDADRAKEIGLINRVVPVEALGVEAQALAETIAGKLGAAVRIGKRAFYDQLNLPLEAAYAHTGAVMAENMLHAQTEKGIAAFLDKRTHEWEQ